MEKHRAVIIATTTLLFPHWIMNSGIAGGVEHQVCDADFFLSVAGIFETTDRKLFGSR